MSRNNNNDEISIKTRDYWEALSTDKTSKPETSPTGGTSEKAPTPPPLPLKTGVSDQYVGYAGSPSTQVNTRKKRKKRGAFQGTQLWNFT
ncbi:hypothetical protein BaRGS_00001301, partial [Batillaria attramentaria]